VSLTRPLHTRQRPTSERSDKPDLRGSLCTSPSRGSRISGAPLRWRSRCTASGTRDAFPSAYGGQACA
jgi:hypothetical protein